MSTQNTINRRKALKIGSQVYRDDGFLISDLTARYGVTKVKHALKALKITARVDQLLTTWEAQMVAVFCLAGGKLKQ